MNIDSVKINTSLTRECTSSYLFSKWASVIFSSFLIFCNLFAVASSSFLWKQQSDWKVQKATCRMLTLKLWSSKVVIIASSKLWSSQSSLFIFSSVLASCSRRLFLRWESKIQYLQNWTCYCRGRDTCRPFLGCFQISSPHFSPLLLAKEPSPETH